MKKLATFPAGWSLQKGSEFSKGIRNPKMAETVQSGSVFFLNCPDIYETIGAFSKIFEDIHPVSSPTKSGEVLQISRKRC